MVCLLPLCSVALTAGLTYFVLSYMFYGTSGGHFNPSVTLAILLTRRTTPLRALFYFGTH